MEQSIRAAGGHACGPGPAIRRRLRSPLTASAPGLSGAALLLAAPGLAQAHVRWFSQAATDDAAPQALVALFGSPLFVALLVLALGAVAWVRSFDAQLAAGGSRFMRLQRRIDSRMSQRAAPLLRGGCALFFACIALHYRAAPITLTPELVAPTHLVVPLQLAIAGALLLRAGVIPACAGMVLLYAYSAWLYGMVHLLDYHLFLGICAFLSLDRLSRRHGEGSGLLLLRLLVATSFLWVGVEKWLYPEWTCDILQHQFPMLAMGMDPDAWAMAAGFVEVTFAFLLLFGGVSSQVAAAALLLLMAAAVPVVGTVDGIGHLPMIFALLVLATTRNRLPHYLREHGGWRPAEFCGVFLVAVLGVTGLYFLAHEFTPAVHSRLVDVWADTLAAGAASATLAWWVARQPAGVASCRSHQETPMARQEDWQAEVRDGMRREGWSVTGPTRVVKVVPRAGALATALKGFVCLEKVLVGKSPPEIERALGLPPGYLAGGCRIYRLKRLPMASEVEYELTARFPDGQAFNPAMHDPRYGPGDNSIHQWKLLNDVPAEHLLDLGPGDRYPYQHG